MGLRCARWGGVWGGGGGQVGGWGRGIWGIGMRIGGVRGRGRTQGDGGRVFNHPDDLRLRGNEGAGLYRSVVGDSCAIAIADTGSWRGRAVSGLGRDELSVASRGNVSAIVHIAGTGYRRRCVCGTIGPVLAKQVDGRCQSYDPQKTAKHKKILGPPSYWITNK